MASSVSESDQNYVEICRAAAVDTVLFNQFRRDPRYTTILEHVSNSLGKIYLECLSAGGRAASQLVEAAKNDAIGKPLTMQLESGLDISPTTLRYLKVADDLERHFGSLDGADVVEIGVGYGGQCRVLDCIFKLRSYTLVDLRPVLALADRFLGNFPLRCGLRFRTMNELLPHNYDLVISNYAFSELRREVQETYFNKVLRHCQKGYITYNEINPSEYRTFTVDEIRNRLNAQVFAEHPLTDPKNCIVVWNQAPALSEQTVLRNESYGRDSS
jgi:hypothetical protein